MRIFNKETDHLSHNFDYNVVETEELKKVSYENISIEDLRRIALWKLDRVIEVPDELLFELKQLPSNKSLTVDSDLSKSILKDLVACDGIGYPMASAFLKFIRPDIYPIIDVRAYRALYGKRISYSQYTTEIYVEYAKELKAISDRRDIPLSKIDEQLYCFDKEFNGSING
jgi:thermostable 8-oxoguanine DNA glycosylase